MSILCHVAVLYRSWAAGVRLRGCWVSTGIGLPGLAVCVCVSVSAICGGGSALESFQWVGSQRWCEGHGSVVLGGCARFGLVGGGGVVLLGWVGW
jgi:hypothetical protein